MAAIVTKDGVIECPKTKWIRVSNISQGAKKDQIKKLFDYFGEIEEIRVYPSDEFTAVCSKVSYIRFANFHSSNGAIHLTNTVFVDRPLIITPIYDDKIPDEESASTTAKVLASDDMAQYVIGGMIMHGYGQLNLNYGFPHVPPKPIVASDLTSGKVEETQKTIFLYNVHIHSTTEIILAIFSGVGEIKYIRLCDYPDKKSKYGLIEYSDVNSVLPALQYHGFPIFGRPVQTAYSCTYIVKPDDWRKRPASNRSASPSPTKYKRLSPPRYTHRSILRRTRSPSFGRYRRRRSRSRQRALPPPVRTPPRRREKSRTPPRKDSKHRKRSKSKERKTERKSKDKKERSRSKDRKEKRNSSSKKDSKKEKSKKRSKRSKSRNGNVRSRSSS